MKGVGRVRTQKIRRRRRRMRARTRTRARARTRRKRKKKKKKRGIEGVTFKCPNSVLFGNLLNVYFGRLARTHTHTSTWLQNLPVYV